MWCPGVCFQTDCNGDCSWMGIVESCLSEISIYPNPSDESLTIETNSHTAYFVEITSQSGQLLFSRNMEGTTHQLDLSSLQKGVYLITIRSGGFVTTRKIVKL